MKILLTNDDGIYAEGIYSFYKELKKIADVIVVAPDSERSSVGHGITLAHPIWQRKVNRKGKFFGYAISGTPADCVKFGLSVVLKQKPDLIISGVNQGSNDGCSVFYSGTVAGAREGALVGIPSMAVSLGSFVVPQFEHAAKVGAKLARSIYKKGLPEGTFLNVNVPYIKSGQFKGIKFTRQGKYPIHEIFQKRTDPNLRTYYWMTGKMPPTTKDLEIDTNALRQGYVAVTPVQCDVTDYTFLKRSSSWKI